jgi:hypothetical protein
MTREVMIIHGLFSWIKGTVVRENDGRVIVQLEDKVQVDCPIDITLPILSLEDFIIQQGDIVEPKDEAYLQATLSQKPITAELDFTRHGQAQ